MAAEPPIAASTTTPLYLSRPISECWAEAFALQTRLDRGEHTDVEEGLLFERMNALGNAALIGPIRTTADALAKLRAAGIFEHGAPPDGANGPAYEEAMRWLEAHHGR